MLDTIKINWDLLGAKFALLSDEEQAQFFKGFAFELGKYESSYKREMQMFLVADKLNKREKDVLAEALSCLWYEDIK